MFERRLRLFLLVIFLGAFLLTARAAQVQVFQRDNWLARATSDAERPIYLPARRGDLLDYTGCVLATDVPSFEASVNFRVMGRDPDARWLKQEAERRARLRDDWRAADDDHRLLMISEEAQAVRNDLETMWATLARLSGKNAVDIDAIRDEIVGEVNAKHESYIQRQFDAAMHDFETAPQAAWYARLVAGTPKAPERATFEKKLIGDQLGFHAVLTDLTQNQYNQLALAQENFPQYRPEGGASTCVLKLGPAVVRRYPFADIACHVIGHVGRVSAEDRERDPHKDDELRRYGLNDRIGREGLEALAEEQLRGTRGTKYADRKGAQLRAEEAGDGADVKTTIDIGLQHDIQEAFKKVSFLTPDPADPETNLKEHDVLSMNGAAVVIDIKTGQVRALVSVPTYDLNSFDELYAELDKDELNRPLTNRALLDAIEPGSTVKPIVGLGVTTQKLARFDDTIECTGYPIINGVKVPKPRCWTMSLFGSKGLGDHHRVPTVSPHPTGFLTLTDAIERSCNVYFITQGDKLGLEGLSYWMRQFGFGRPTGIGLPEARGLVPSMAVIEPSERQEKLYEASIGQGPVNATPMQVANEMATIARDGIWQRSTLLVNPPPTTQPAAADEKVDERADAVPDRYDLHLDPDALRAVHQGMIEVVNDAAGTGTQVRSDKVLIAAKTGSATASQLIRYLKDESGQLLRDEAGTPRYELVPYGAHDQPNPEVPWYRMSGVDGHGRRKGTHGWVAGYMPADHPQIAFAVYVEFGNSGGISAGSVVRTLTDACIQRGYVTAKRSD